METDEQVGSRTRGWAIAATLLAVVAVAAALGWWVFDVSDGSGRSDPGSDPERVAVYEDDGVGMDALLGGTLRISDACVTISGGNTEWTPIFPRGTVTVEGDVFTWKGQTYRDGDAIEVGGGEASGNGSYTIPTACPRGNLWLVSPQ